MGNAPEYFFYAQITLIALPQKTEIFLIKNSRNSRDAAVEEFRKLRKRSENKSGQLYGVTLIKELRGGGKKPVLTTKIIASSNERVKNVSKILKIKIFQGN